MTDPRSEQIGSIAGAERSRVVSIVFFALSFYDYMITFDDEVKHFWKGPWTISRFLFFVNRYLPLSILSFVVICITLSNPSPEFCIPAIKAAFFLNIFSIGGIQAILVTRTWYLFSYKHSVRVATLLAFIISIITSFVLLWQSLRELRLPEIPSQLLAFPFFAGCHVARPPNFWRTNLPSLILHTILYILTAYKALRNRRLLKTAPVLKRLLRDGGFFYLVVLVSVAYTSIGSTLSNFPLINIPAIFSHVLLSLTSIATSRVMFSIHSLADNIGSDSAWLLNNAELRRLDWKQGAHEGELIIEHKFVDVDDDPERKPISVRMTHVGVIQEPTW